ncbi:MAG TPA: SPOR domain-containing protein [Noviherbaspirillum sp.]|nr:SPOR domain-containing protein [Noviherbaspirillum sp.]
MSLFSILRKNKQESASDDTAFYSRAEEESQAVRSRTKRKSAQGGTPADPVLPEKKRARRRLIGAVALVLAAVIGLPMILDSEPKPLADDIAIQIPSKDKPAKAADAKPANASVNRQPDSSLDAKEEIIEPSPAQTKAPLAQQPAPPAQAKVKDADKPNSGSQSALNAKADAKPTEHADDGARARALLEGKADPKAAEKSNGKFVIQVAALATKDKVDELQAKLKQAGIKSYTQKVATESGERTRIRVGPFSSKEEAEKVRAKIVKLGLNGTVVPA